MIISIPNGGFMEIDDDKYWSLSDQELLELEEKIKTGYYNVDDTDPLYSKRDISDEDIFYNFEE